jgi:hypothetical protein
MKYTNILFIVIFTLINNNIFADQSPLPTVKEYKSKNGQYKFTVKPRVLSGQLQYFVDAVDGIKNPGQLEGERDKCIGVLEKKTEKSYAKIWEAALDNDVSPASALVSDSGNYVVTFDNWHRTGLGDNIIVIYNKVGKLIIKYGLNDIISLTERIRMSFQFWGEGNELDEENDFLILKLIIAPFPSSPYARGRDLEMLRVKSGWYKMKGHSKTLRRIRLSDGLLIDKPLIDKKFEFPEFECERDQRVIQYAEAGRIWQYCIINNKQGDINSKKIPDGKIQVSAYISGAWFKEVTGQYKNGKKHGTWVQILNEKRKRGQVCC